MTSRPQTTAHALEAAAAWIAADPDPETRAALLALRVQAQAEGAAGNGDGDASAALQARMRERLEFGTAGLRGLVGAGPGRLNRATVIRATYGLCQWLLREVPEAAARGVCVGFDARPDSRRFAHDVAAVVAGQGIKARVFEDLAPTPLVGFAVLDQGAAAGVVITASHNPPEYNGYKVYWQDGAQIIPPHDAGIAAAIEACPSASDVPLADEESARAAGRWCTLEDSVRARYIEGVLALLPDPHGPRDLRIAYTPLHGVGKDTVLRVLERAGFHDVSVVPTQAEPDGSFPTVRFPNPEEEGALDALAALARELDAPLGVANDPDADRLAVLARGPEGDYEALSGNDIGCLLAHYLLDATDAESAPGERVVINTVVSSPLLAAIARAHGAKFAQTLTGHKWIHSRALKEEAKGRRFVMGYEEALGYAVGPLVRDKDGISALLLFCDFAARCAARGQTVIEARDAMLRRYGVFVSRQESLVLPGAEGRAQIDTIMARARALHPAALAEIPVHAIVDGQSATRQLSGSARGGGAEREPEQLGWVPSALLVFELEGGHRAMLRPSGTEPKLKFYYDARTDAAQGESITEARARAAELASALRDALVRDLELDG